MSDVKCPYCGNEQEINHDDGYGCEDGGGLNSIARTAEKNSNAPQADAANTTTFWR